ncbi:MAG: polysaccharide biosynthesis/export family protein [Myxococcota bacterium]
MTMSGKATVMMRLFLLGLLMGGVGCATTCPVVGPGDVSEFEVAPPVDYRLQSGDVLRVEVWQNKALSRTVRIRPDGKMSLPNLGDVVAAGATVAELSSSLVDALKVYLPDPLVTIAVEEWVPIEVYVLGEVRRPDAYPVSSTRRLLAAVARAGGVQPGAAGCAVVLRRTESKVLRRVVDLNALGRGEVPADDLPLRSGDVVTVH